MTKEERQAKFRDEHPEYYAFTEDRRRQERAEAKRNRAPLPLTHRSEIMRQYRLRNPLKNWARKIVFVEKRAGRLKQLSCYKCGNTKSEAHHHDYSKPLDIVWACKRHHAELDKQLRTSRIA